MNRLLILIILLSVNILGQEENSRLIIKTNSPNTAIFLDEELVGEGNIDLEIEPGEYELFIRSDKRKWGSETIKENIVIPNGTPVTLVFNFDSKILLETSPEDAYLMKGENIVGHTPLFVSPELKSFEIRKPGYTSQFIDDIQNIKSEKIKLDFSNVEETKLFRETGWFNVLIGSAIVLGGTAAYYKIKADKEYDQYLQTDEQSHLDNTDKYDLFSGIAFGALQVNFGFILYYLLTD